MAFGCGLKMRRLFWTQTYLLHRRPRRCAGTSARLLCNQVGRGKRRRARRLAPPSCETRHRTSLLLRFVLPCHLALKRARPRRLGRSGTLSLRRHRLRLLGRPLALPHRLVRLLLTGGLQRDHVLGLRHRRLRRSVCWLRKGCGCCCFCNPAPRSLCSSVASLGARYRSRIRRRRRRPPRRPRHRRARGALQAGLPTSPEPLQELRAG
mmetsp:Transcript_173182/g.555386  ORF Transcript_173182/g.555386 Transcript_173182/m.555386 type:complete len:208 (+) Transcript_173182:1009-1632(+)